MMTTDNKLRAVMFALAAVGTASLQDAIVKSFSGDFPAPQILVFRAIGSAPLLLWLLFRDNTWRNFWPAEQRGLLLARSAILCSAYVAFICSIASLPIATSVAIYFTMPFFVAGLAGRALGERVPLYRWIAIAAAFIGVLIMVQPGSSRFESAMLFALYSAFGYAVGQLIGRHLTRSVSTVVISNWQNIVYGSTGLLLALVVNVFDLSGSTDKSIAFLTRAWLWPNLMQWIGLLVMGTLAAMGSLMFVSAYKYAEANFVAPFEYTALIWATLYGVLLFGDFPDRYTVMGAAVVVSAGLFMIWCERHRVGSGTPTAA